MNDVPQLLRCDNRTGRRWLQVKLVGTVSNRSAIGARVTCVAGGRRQMNEVRSGGSYLSQSDLRLHFGLGEAETADLEIRWPSGKEQRLVGVKANQALKLTEAKN